MFKFFRRIRQKLLSDNKIAKYLIYASGEIVLVVIGILIALQVNNWNEARKDRIAETALLQQLHGEFESNLIQLEEKMMIRDNAISGALQLLYYIDNPGLRETDSILVNLGQTLTAPTFDPIVNDLISAGRLQLLQNNELKRLLSSWTSEIVQVKEEENAWKQIRETRYFPFLIKETSFRIILNSYFESGQFDLHLIDKDASIELTLHKKEVNFNVIDLLENEDLEDYLAECAAFHAAANSQSEIMKERIESILVIIQSQLDSEN
ncbi:MAG: hypothetical protein JJ895_00575 [Balneolaceae bacterium]|nr:hypothetical protein [Balneolaceae bacterium]